MNDDDQKFLKPEEVVSRWNDAVQIGTLANWRAKKKGPPFTKFGANVRYPLAELIKWEKENIQMPGESK